jgi:F-type H+-transporting ATPase subunit b
MRRLLLVALLCTSPAYLFAQHTDTAAQTTTVAATHATDMTGDHTATSGEANDVAHGAEKVAHEQAHPTEDHGEGAHQPKTYFGIPAWILKFLNMVFFIGALIWLAGGPVKKSMAERREQIRRDAEEAASRRARADQMASEIQTRLSQIEQDVAAIHERAQVEGERQKRELIAAAEVEAQKILTAARNEVDNRLKHARHELTEYAGQLASERAEAILRERITDADRSKLFHESVQELGR